MAVRSRSYRIAAVNGASTLSPPLAATREGRFHCRGIDAIVRSAPQWSSDGSTLFVSVRRGSENLVIALSLASSTSTEVVLPAHEGLVCWDLSVRPGGARFAYVEGGPGGPDTTRLWTIPASGGDAVPLTDGRSNVWSPTWSNDGRRVFYVSNRIGSMDLWQQTVGDDGSALGEPVALTPGLGIRTVSFSPDGSKLAYTRGGLVANVWRVPLLANRTAPRGWMQRSSRLNTLRFSRLTCPRMGCSSSWIRTDEATTMCGFFPRLVAR